MPRQKKTSKKKENLKQVHKKIKKKQFEEEKKKKVIKRLNSIHYHPEHKIKLKKPSTIELEKHLHELTEKYDHGIKLSRKLYSELEYFGLTHNGLKEKKNESIKQRTKRISKINFLHPQLIKTLEENKNLEKQIEYTHKLILQEKI